MKLALSIILPWKLLDLKAIKAGSCGAGSGGGDLTIESFNHFDDCSSSSDESRGRKKEFEISLSLKNEAQLKILHSKKGRCHLWE